MVKDLISIRSEYGVFRLDNREEIEKRIHILDGLSNYHMTSFIFEDEKCNLFVIIKNDYSTVDINLSNTTMIFDGFKRVNIADDNYVITSPGVFILRKDEVNDYNR